MVTKEWGLVAIIVKFSYSMIYALPGALSKDDDESDGMRQGAWGMVKG